MRERAFSTFSFTAAYWRGVRIRKGGIRGKKSCGGTQDHILSIFLALSWRYACLSYDCISQHCIIDIIILDPSAYGPNDAALSEILSLVEGASCTTHGGIYWLYIRVTVVIFLRPQHQQASFCDCALTVYVWYLEAVFYAGYPLYMAVYS